MGAKFWQPIFGAEGPKLGTAALDESAALPRVTSDRKAGPPQAVTRIEAHRNEVAEAEDGEDIALRRRLRVIDGRTKKPVAGIEVRVARRAVVEAVFERRVDDDENYDPGPVPYAFYVYCAQHGAAHRTDERGELELVQNLENDGWLDVVIEHARGRATVGFDPEESNEFEDDPSRGDSREDVREVVLQSSRDHVIEVLDATRAPAAGVPLAVFLVDRADVVAYEDTKIYGEDDDYDTRDVEPFMHAVSDSAGRVTLRMPERILRDWREENAGAEDDQHPAEFFVVPRIPFRRPPVLRLPLLPMGSTLHRLTLPPTGPLEIRLERPDGRRLVLAAQATVEGPQTAFRRGRLRMDVEEHLRARKAFGADAQLEFPRVGLGVKLAAYATLEPQGLGASAELRAVSSSGGDPRRVLRFPAHYCFVDLRVLSSGHPLREIRIILEDARKIYLNGGWKPCPDGVTRLIAKLQAPPVVNAQLTLFETDHANRRAILDEVEIAAGRSVDLGTIELQEFDAWIRGTVRDRANKPLAGAKLQLVRRVESSGRAKAALSHHPLWNLKTTTDPNGHYALPYVPTNGMVYLRASSPKHRVTFEPVAGPGRRDFVLPRLARLDVRWKNVPTRVSRLKFTARRADVEPWESSRQRRMNVRASKRGDASRSLVRTIPGRWILRCTARNLVGSCERIVDVGPGSTEIVEFDFGQLHRYEFTMLDERGLPGDLDPQIEWRAPYDAIMSSARLVFASGRAQFYSTQPEVELDFLHGGYATLRRVWASGSHRVRMTRARRIDLHFDDPEGLLDARAWSVEAVPAYGDEIPKKRRTRRLRHERDRARIVDGKVRLELGGAFLHRLDLLLGTSSIRVPIPLPPGDLMGGPDPSGEPRVFRVRVRGALRASILRCISRR